MVAGLRRIVVASSSEVFVGVRSWSRVFAGGRIGVTVGVAGRGRGLGHSSGSQSSSDRRRIMVAASQVFVVVRSRSRVFPGGRMGVAVGVAGRDWGLGRSSGSQIEDAYGGFWSPIEDQ